MVNTLGQWFEEDYSKYPKEKWCLMDYMANWIRSIRYEVKTDIENLIDMCYLHSDVENGYSSIEDWFENIKEYVELSGGLKEFDYYC